MKVERRGFYFGGVLLRKLLRISTLIGRAPEKTHSFSNFEFSCKIHRCYFFAWEPNFDMSSHLFAFCLSKLWNQFSHLFAFWDNLKFGLLPYLATFFAVGIFGIPVQNGMSAQNEGKNRGPCKHSKKLLFRRLNPDTQMPRCPDTKLPQTAWSFDSNIKPGVLCRREGVLPKYQFFEGCLHVRNTHRMGYWTKKHHKPPICKNKIRIKRIRKLTQHEVCASPPPFIWTNFWVPCPRGPMLSHIKHNRAKKISSGSSISGVALKGTTRGIGGERELRDNQESLWLGQPKQATSVRLPASGTWGASPLFGSQRWRAACSLRTRRQN